MRNKKINASLKNHLQLGNYPTPIYTYDYINNLTNTQIYFKMDSMICPDIGSTKIRKLEFILKRALDRGIKDFITVGNMFSNQCLTLAELSYKMKFNVYLFLNNGKGDEKKIYINTLLKYVDKSNIFLLQENQWKYYGLEIEKLKKKLSVERKSCEVIPLGASSAIGMLGIIKMLYEIKEQNFGSFPYDYIICPVGSGGLAVGLDIALQIAKIEYCKIIGVSVADKLEILNRRINKYYFDFNAEFNTNFKTKYLELFENINEGYGLLNKFEKEISKKISENINIIIEEKYNLKTFLKFYDLLVQKILHTKKKYLEIITG
ncbi:MAG TPA: pyridoxal-phosphate dependent enzyme [bacterium]|nr:pyridoxal-phosphate dependent enzyme [bacterium]HOL48442.1 pyridoxal-phosphate dependent enzyme [bacterium]HPQ19742.1 pyridoxal-phosphate dependent enzyme [bacterium]